VWRTSIELFGFQVVSTRYGLVILMGQTGHVGLPGYFSCYNRVRPANSFS
jgi:hypothetical protein